MATAPVASAPTPADSPRTPWSRAAAAGSMGLAGLQLDLLVRGTEPAAYLVLVLVLGALACGAASVGIAVRNCLTSRAVAGALGLGTVMTVSLLLTVGLPGAGAQPLGASSGLGAALGAAVPALIAADAWCRWSR